MSFFFSLFATALLSYTKRALHKDEVKHFFMAHTLL